MKQYFKIAIIILITFSLFQIQKTLDHSVNIAGNNFLRLFFAMQTTCCTVMSTNYVFLPSNIDFPNLNQQTYFLGGICVHLESSERILGVVGI